MSEFISFINGDLCMRTLDLRPVSIALLGITTNTVFANNNAEVNSAQQLATIVVSAAGFEQKLKDAPASITVITEKDLKDKRINSIADALIDIEGVDISPQAGKTGGLNIRIRGMDSEYSLVLIDGRRQNSTGDITPNVLANPIIVLFLQFLPLSGLRLFVDLLQHSMVLMLWVVLSISSLKKYPMNGQVVPP